MTLNFRKLKVACRFLRSCFNTISYTPVPKHISYTFGVSNVLRIVINPSPPVFSRALPYLICDPQQSSYATNTAPRFRPRQRHQRDTKHSGAQRRTVFQQSTHEECTTKLNGLRTTLFDHRILLQPIIQSRPKPIMPRPHLFPLLLRTRPHSHL